MFKKILLLLLLTAAPALAQIGPIQGHSFLGGTQAKTQGLTSSNYLNGIIPHATISVYYTGTTTLVPGSQIFSNSTGTVLGNPFTSNNVTSVNPGGYLFFISLSVPVDVIGSGGISPNTYPVPVPLCVDCFASQAGGGGGSGCGPLSDDATSTECGNNLNFGTGTYGELFGYTEGLSGNAENGVILNGTGNDTPTGVSFTEGAGPIVADGVNNFNLNSISADLGDVYAFGHENFNGGESGGTLEANTVLAVGLSNVCAANFGTSRINDSFFFGETNDCYTGSGTMTQSNIGILGDTSFNLNLGTGTGNYQDIVGGGDTSIQLGLLNGSDASYDIDCWGHDDLNGDNVHDIDCGGHTVLGFLENSSYVSAHGTNIGNDVMNSQYLYLNGFNILQGHNNTGLSKIIASGANLMPDDNLSGLTNIVCLANDSNCETSNQTTLGNASTTSLLLFGCGTGAAVLADGSGTCFVPGSGGGGSVGTAGQLQMVGSTAGSFAASAATDNGSLFAITEPASIASAGASQFGFTYNATPIVPGSSTTFVIGANSSGQGVMSETGGAAARICDATNGVCGGGSSGFPIVLGSTSIAASSTTTAIAGMTGFGLSDTTTAFSAYPNPATFALNWTPSSTTPVGVPPFPSAVSAVGTFNFDSSTRSGFNNVANSLYVDTESNGNTNSSYGILGATILVNHNGNANSDSDYGINEYTANLGTGTAGEQIGGLFNTQNGAGNVTQSDVIDGAVNQVGSGTITRAHTFYAEATIFSAGAITNNYMFYAQSPNRNGGSGTIGTQYGSYLEQQKVTGVTTGWGYYEAGNDANFLGGALQVTGNLTVNVTGSTQCLEVSSSGVVSGTGTTCGSGSGTVLTITGDGSLINNVSSTGGVTLTLGNAAAHKYWGNNTGSTTTPAYESIALADLPSLSANTVLGALTATTPSGLAVPSCSGSTNALTWTSGTGFGCNTISGGASDALPAYGSLVSFSSAGFSTSGWTANGTTPTVTGGNLVFSGGAGTFTQTYDRTTIGSSSAYDTTLPIWAASETITVGTVNSTSFGIGLGIRSTASLGASAPYGLVCRIDLSTSGIAGQVIIDEFNGSGTATQVANSPALTFAAGDSIALTLNRNYSQLTCAATDLTTATQPSAVASYTMPYTSGTTVLGPNVGHFSIYNLGGTQTVTAFSVSSAAPASAQLAYIGDSKTAGYFQGARAFSNPYSVAQTSVTLAGGGETTDDITANVPEIVALAPKNIILDVGRNNFCLGSDSVATTETKYQTLVTALLGDGFNVWNLLTWEPSCANVATFDSWIASNYSSWTGTGTSYLIDPKLQNYGGASASGTAISSDGIHPNAQGAYYISQAINAALMGQSGTNKFIPSLPPSPLTSAAAASGFAACVKSVNPVVIGTCSTQPTSSGACTCN